jgi:glycosyltransferase involved in cell wall biosynthesis
VLGVSFLWTYAKGLDVFIDLARRLPEDYRLVLVGTNDEIDRQLPENVISIHRTLNQAELAEIYTAADVFINPTRQEVFGLVNVEALACGTPVITFRAGGSPECIDETCGSVVECNDTDAMYREILRICEQAPYPAAACRAYSMRFIAQDKHQQTLTLYQTGKTQVENKDGIEN